MFRHLGATAIASTTIFPAIAGQAPKGPADGIGLQALEIPMAKARILASDQINRTGTKADLSARLIDIGVRAQAFRAYCGSSIIFAIDPVAQPQAATNESCEQSSKPSARPNTPGAAAASSSRRNAFARITKKEAGAKHGRQAEFPFSNDGPAAIGVAMLLWSPRRKNAEYGFNCDLGHSFQRVSSYCPRLAVSAMPSPSPSSATSTGLQPGLLARRFGFTTEVAAT